MKVQRLSLSNYRGFTQLDLEFGPQITVLAGVNGSGKSGVLRALAALLSHLLRHEGPSKEAPVSLSAADVQVGKSALTLSGTFGAGVRTLHAQITRSVPDPSKAPEYAQRRDKAREALRYTKKDRAMEKQLLEEIRYLGELLEDRGDLFFHQVEAPKLRRRGGEVGNPFAVFYPTSRYFRGAGTRSLQIQAFDPARSCAEAFEGAPVSLFECANWFYAAQQGAIGTKANSKRLLGYLEAVVEALLPGFSNLRIEPSPPRLFVKKGRTELELGQLSDGERGLLALAFDLTRRLAIANPRLKNPVTDGEAVVLLDEIELHLHPSWQRKILRRLATTFKNCQFIVTTHSPQVVGQAEPNSLRLLNRDADGRFTLELVTQSFGMDSNWVLQEIMDTPARDYVTERKLAAVHEAVDAGKLRKARGLAKALEDELGLFPELQEIKSLLDRFEMLKGK